MAALKALTLCIPFYRQPGILREQIDFWNRYPPEIRIALVDDGSPEPALPIVLECASAELRQRMDLYRITVDKPWNRGGARNLASREAQTEWLLHADIDHVLPVDCATRLLVQEPNPKHWFRFERYRKGMADDTRKKDAIGVHVPFGKIKPHIDSYLVTKSMYWAASGYNESFTGCLGGGSPFLSELTKVGGEPRMLPSDIHLHVYTASVMPDASVRTLSRDRTEYAKRKAAMRGNYRGTNPIRFPWIRQDLNAG